ncbi:hypothetical protein [Neptunicella marina]|uniref:Uncharacterized protein n=1 Tax=Neptunicella marina TaxID=2125989 RepID=A0A8J6LYG3_9ALTE|nr:hypothetical protein [Neptunicella marina]MBC3766179.1 hypothetical protein [Neptunicella marina]
MNWINRYVNNVKSYLPKSLKDDVGNELESSLQDQIDDKAEQLQRELNEQEIQQILLERGHPIVVASSYQSAKTLVTPELFPLYKVVLKWVFLLLFVVKGTQTLSGAFSQEHINVFSTALHFIGNIFESCLYGFAWTTLAFYLIGNAVTTKQVYAKWHPSKLPNIPAPNQQIGLFDAAFEMVCLFGFIAVMNNYFMPITGEPAARYSIHMSDALYALVPWISAVVSLSIVFCFYKMLSPYWTRGKIIIDWAIYAAQFAMLAVMYQLPQSLTLIYPLHGEQTTLQLSQHQWQTFLSATALVFMIDIGFKVKRFIELGR